MGVAKNLKKFKEIAPSVIFEDCTICDDTPPQFTEIFFKCAKAKDCVYIF